MCSINGMDFYFLTGKIKEMGYMIGNKIYRVIPITIAQGLPVFCLLFLFCFFVVVLFCFCWCFMCVCGKEPQASVAKSPTTSGVGRIRLQFP